MENKFQLFSTTHFVAIAACVFCLFAIYFYVKNGQNKIHRQRDIWVFTIVFVLIEVALVGSKILSHQWSLRYNLPLHLCDISAISILYALHTRSRAVFELGYFWGFVGGLMAILTPNLEFVDWYFAPFFVWHLFLIAGPVYQLFTDDFVIPYKSIYRTLGVTVLLSSAMFLFNRALGSNYMFVNEKISSFDALGLPDFPLFLPYLLAMAFALFHLVWAISFLLKRN